MDVEAYERNHNIITEIGISTLDTLDLVDVVPGENGENWREKIRARHFRIHEHMHYTNKEFVHGCADKFEFGTSEVISLEDAPRIIASCFKPPFSRLATADEAAASWPAAESPLPGQAPADPPKRALILVGHGTTQDIAYLQALGYNPLNLSTLLETLDTAALYRSLQRDPQPKSLGTVLYELGMAGWHLHNAGNDAVYTLQATLAIAVREAARRGSREVGREREEAGRERLSGAVQEAIARVCAEREGWSSAEEGEDGGVPEKAGKESAEGKDRGASEGKQKDVELPVR